MLKSIFSISAILLFVTMILNFNTVDSAFISDTNKNYSILSQLGYNKLENHKAVSNIKVGIIDSGFTLKSEQINLIKKHQFDNTHSNNRVMHGDVVATVLGGNSSLNYKGIISDAQYYFYDIPESKLSTKNVTKAFLEAVNDEVDVINICLTVSQYNESLHAAIKLALSKNIVIVASSGNDSSQGNYPASFEEKGVISVGALDKNNNILENTSYENADVYAPGENIHSVEGGKVVHRSGTSVSTPLVTPAIVLLKAKCNGIKNTRIEELISETSLMYNGYYGNENKLIKLFDANKLLEEECYGGG